MKLAKFKELLDKSERVLLLLHREPDGDTIASSLALAYYLRKIGKVAECASSEEIPKIFQFLPGSSDVKNDFFFGDYDLIIAVDCGDASRTGFPARLVEVCKKKPLVNIDHHLKSDLHKIARLNLVDEKSSAVAEMLWEIFDYLSVELDSRIATYILAGIYYDTGGFQHSNVTDQTLKVVSECLRLGGRIALISQNIGSSKSYPALRLTGIALKRIKLRQDGIVTSFLTKDDLKSVGASAEDATGIVNLINSIPSAKIAILFVELSQGIIKASLRTEKDDIDVSQLARLFGGGGHRKAGGFLVEERVGRVACPQSLER